MLWMRCDMLELVMDNLMGEFAFNCSKQQFSLVHSIELHNGKDKDKDKDLFIGPQEFVVGYSKAPE